MGKLLFVMVVVLLAVSMKAHNDNKVAPDASVHSVESDRQM